MKKIFGRLSSLKKDLSKILSVSLIALGLIVIGAILIWAPVCEGLIPLASGKMVPMKCHYTGQASLLLSILLIVSSVESIAKKSIRPWTVLSIGIMLFAITFDSVIGICMKDTMSCHNTALWLRVAGILTVVCGIIALAAKSRQVKN